MRRAIADLVVRALSLPEGTDVPVTTPPDRAMGDYAVAMFLFAKALKAAPPALAAKVAAAFAPGGGLASATAAGPFVNFRVDRAAFFADVLTRVAAEGARYCGNAEGAGKTVVIDYGSPNIKIGRASCRERGGVKAVDGYATETTARVYNKRYR